MTRNDYRLWLAYHCGSIQGKLTARELEKFRAFDFALHILVPQNILLDKLGGYNKLQNLNIYHNYPLIKKLAKEFCVTEDLILIQLANILKKNHTKQKVLKKEDNIIYVKF